MRATRNSRIVNVGLWRRLAAGLVVVFLAGAAFAQPDIGPEPMLTHVVKQIEESHLHAALTQVDRLVKAYPNFRLGNLIKGDLLLAQAHPIKTFGNVSDAPPGSIASLRAEAIVRLNASRDRPPPDHVPAYLLQMSPDDHYAIVVDAQKSRLYLYQNDGGIPHFVSDYYVTQGKDGTDKTRAGDDKTPIGVYHITAHLPPSKLSPIYGSGAFPISYPNEWDRLNHRSGYGIWLHGTPPNTFSRPPKASNGCVALANQDLDAIAKDLQIGLTPVIISNSIKWLSLDQWQAQRDAFRKEIADWRTDWQSLDVDRFLSHYSPSFVSRQGRDFAQWSAEKRKVDAGKLWIKVSTRNLSIFRNPGKQPLVMVTFDQDYRSNDYSNVMRKRQYWLKQGGRWQIIYEGPA